MEDTGAADDCQLIALRAELLLSAVATLDREGYRVSDERVTLGGHSNGGRAAFYAQAWNMADAIGIDIAAVLGLDASTDWPDCLDSPPSLGTASLLSIGGSFPASLAALEAQWPTDGAVAAIDLDFQHDYLNSVWVDLTEAGHCASGSDLTYGPPRPGDFPRVARIARCAVSNFLAWRVRGSLVASTWFLDGPRALDGVNPEDIEQLEIRWPLFAPLA
jgi:hypothetical protein